MIIIPGVIEYVEVRGERQIQQVKDLFSEYAGSIGFSLRFQGFEKEIEELPGEYAPPDGCLFLSIDDGNAIGCVGLRALSGAPSDKACEMKRLYVRLQYRRSGIGRKLSEIVIARAVEVGYCRMRLDTISTMTEAVGLYQSLGFKEIDPYRYNPIEGAAFMELELPGRG